MSHCFRENPHDLVILSHNLKWKLFLQGWSNQTTHQCYYAGHPAGILFFNQTLKVILETILQMEFINLLLWIFANNQFLAFVIVFLSSLSFLLPFFIILTFCSHLLLPSLSVELFSSWPPSAYLFIFSYFSTHFLFYLLWSLSHAFTPYFNLHYHCSPSQPEKKPQSCWWSFYSFVMRGKTFESVLNSQDPSDPSDDFYSECFIKR